MTALSSEIVARDLVARIQALPRRTTGAVRSIRQHYSKQISAWEPKAVLVLANSLLDQPEFTYHFVAIELVHYHRPTLRSLQAKDLRLLGRQLDSWYATDTFAPLLSGPAWREGQIPDSLIRTWAKSKDRWWRRAALVSTVALNNKARGGHGDVPRTLAVCELLVNDHDDMVVKALSWALRQLVQHNPKAVSKFIIDYADQLAPRVKREVSNKLTTGLKNPKQKRYS